MSIPPELTSALLTALAILGSILGAVLVRRGKREDTRIAQLDQTFEQVRALSADRLGEIERMEAKLEASEKDKDRIREAWEQRWERQMGRCRQVTDALVRSVSALEKLTGPSAHAEATLVLKLLQNHNQDDHPDPPPNT